MPIEQNYANENNATSIHAVNKESPVQILHSTALPLCCQFIYKELKVRNHGRCNGRRSGYKIWLRYCAISLGKTIYS